MNETIKRVLLLVVAFALVCVAGPLVLGSTDPAPFAIGLVLAACAAWAGFRAVRGRPAA